MNVQKNEIKNFNQSTPTSTNYPVAIHACMYEILRLREKITKSKNENEMKISMSKSQWKITLIFDKNAFQ